jgi:hypothetical protein
LKALINRFIHNAVCHREKRNITGERRKRGGRLRRGKSRALWARPLRPSPQ